MDSLINISSIQALKPHCLTYGELEHTYIYCHITQSSPAWRQLFTATPSRLEGVVTILVRGGSPLHLQVNQDDFVLGPNTMLSIMPGKIVTALSPMPADADIYLMFFDTAFMQGVNINLSSVAMPTVVEKPHLLWSLSESECQLVLKYLDLLYENTLETINPQLNRQIGTSLIAAMLYQFVLFFHRHLAEEFDGKVEPRMSGRRHEYVKEFIKLVNLHYTRERSVAFYSDRLFISAKYLSMLVKEATGRSAARWIDDFVLSEAKNMLKFSGKNIQQVAYALNFPTQSSFGKYFKHLTGMSPTEFQKS